MKAQGEIIYPLSKREERFICRVIPAAVALLAVIVVLLLLGG